MTSTARLEHLDAESYRPFRHVPGLDGVRGIAVILVLALHYGSLWEGREGAGWIPGGFIGVDVFFVLSGFLITSLLTAEKAKAGRVNFANFYARRALRLLPALYLLMVGYFAYATAVDVPLRQQAKQILSVVLYGSNFAQVYFAKSMINSGIGNTWSLAIEEQFYLVWPAVLLFGVLRYGKTRTSVITLIAAGAIASAVIRIVVWNWAGGYPAAYMRPDCRADGLLIGALCAFVFRWGLTPAWISKAAMASAAFLTGFAFVVKSSDWVFDYGFLLVSVATGIIILAVAENRTSLRGPFEWSPLRLIGRVSYGLYLWHVLALKAVVHYLEPENAFVSAAAGLALTAVLVTLSWRFVEQPFLRLKRRVASPVSH